MCIKAHEYKVELEGSDVMHSLYNEMACWKSLLLKAESALSLELSDIVKCNQKCGDLNRAERHVELQRQLNRSMLW